GNPRRPADQDHLVDLGRLQPGVGQGLAARAKRPIDDRLDQRLEFRARDWTAETLQTDAGGFLAGQISFRLNHGLAELLHHFGGPAKVGHYRVRGPADVRHDRVRRPAKAGHYVRGPAEAG